MTITRPPDTTRTGPGARRPRGGLHFAGLPIKLTFGAQVLVLLTVLAGALILPDRAPGWPAAAYLAATAALVLGFMGSLIAHELAHALVARRYGADAREVRIGFFGGSGHRRHEFATPRGLWRTAVAGPTASLALTTISVGVTFGLAGLGAGRLPVMVFAAIAWINALLTIVGVLPGAGLDGGRALHGLLWARSGDRARAAITAARTGQFIGALLVAGGVAALALGYLDGIWAGFIGLAMFSASRVQAREVLAVTTLADLRVRDVLPWPGSPQAAIPGWQTVRSFLDGAGAEPRPAATGAAANAGTATVGAATSGAATSGAVTGGAAAFALRDFDGRPAGLLTLSQLAVVPASHRDSLRLTDVATPVRDVVTTTLDEPLGQLLSRLAIRPATPAALHTAGHALVVDDDGAPAGVLTPADFGRASQLGALRRGRRAP